MANMATEEQMQVKNNMRTICEVLREIYQIAEYIEQYAIRTPITTLFFEEAKEIKTRTREAVYMAKRMDSKLRQYKENWAEGMWEEKK